MDLTKEICELAEHVMGQVNYADAHWVLKRSLHDDDEFCAIYCNLVELFHRLASRVSELRASHDEEQRKWREEKGL